MKKLLKILLWTSMGAITLGGLFFLIGCGINGFDWQKLSGTKTEQKLYTATREIETIKIDYDCTDILVIYDDQVERVTIEYPQLQTKKGKNATTVTLAETENTVTISEKRNRVPFALWDFSSPKMTITVPSSTVCQLKLSVDTGDIRFDGEGTFGGLRMETDTGDVVFTGKTVCTGDAYFFTDTGNVTLKNFTANNLTIETDTGDAILSDCTVNGTLLAETDTGDIKMDGSISVNRLRMDLDTGDLKAKGAVVYADNIEIEVDTGDVKMTLSGKQSDYNIIVNVDTGKQNIANNYGGDKTLKIEADTGDVYVYFQE